MWVLAAETRHTDPRSIQKLRDGRGNGLAANSGGWHSKARAVEMVSRQTRYEPRFGGTR